MRYNGSSGMLLSPCGDLPHTSILYYYYIFKIILYEYEHGSQQKLRYKIRQNKQKPQETQPKTWPHEYLIESRATCGILFVWSVYG